MRFNIGFTGNRARYVSDPRAIHCIQAVNHAALAFIENKRCSANPRVGRDMVNQNAASVYQTDALLGLN